MFNNSDQDTIDPNKDYFVELVGEGKKYANPQELAKAIMFKDQHINRIEAENSGMRKDFSDWREQHSTALSLQETLNQLKEQNLTSSDNTQANEDNQKSQQLDMQEIETLFNKRISEYEKTKAQAQNEQIALSKLKERYGQNYEAYLKPQMDALGISQEEALRMARETPALFDRAFLSERQTETFQAPPASRRSDSFAPSGNPVRNEAYYNKMAKEKPDVYWSVKMQNQMHEDAERLGDSYFV